MYQRLTNEKSIFHLTKRLKIISDFIQLGDIEEINKQVQAVRELNLEYICSSIIEALEQAQYDRAVQQIHSLLNRYSEILTYIDPEIAALELELKNLQERLTQIEQNKQNMNAIIRTYRIEKYKRLTPVESAIIVAKHKFYFQKMQHLQAKATTSGVDNSIELQQCQELYEQATYEFEQFERKKKEDEKYYNESRRAKRKSSGHSKDDTTMDETMSEMTRLYREAVFQCHPDRFPEGDQKQLAHNICTRLNNAYAQHDWDTVRLIHEQLKLGLLAVNVPVDNAKRLLRLERDALRQQFEMRAKRYEQIYSLNEQFLTIVPTQNHVTPYLERMEAQLHDELAEWNRQLEEFNKKGILAVSNSFTDSQQCIKRDWEYLIKHPLENIMVDPIDSNDLFHWQGIFIGPDETPYKGGWFLVTIDFPHDFPQEKPMLKLTNKIHHPNVTAEGIMKLCNSQSWSSHDHLRSYLLKMYKIIFYPETQTTQNSSQSLAIQQFRKDQTALDETAKGWADTYPVLYNYREKRIQKQN